MKADHTLPQYIVKICVRTYRRRKRPRKRRVTAAVPPTVVYTAVVPMSIYHTGRLLGKRAYEASERRSHISLRGISILRHSRVFMLEYRQLFLAA